MSDLKNLRRLVERQGVVINKTLDGKYVAHCEDYPNVKAWFGLYLAIGKGLTEKCHQNDKGVWVADFEIDPKWLNESVARKNKVELLIKNV